MAITRLGGANAITGVIPTSVGGTGSTAATLPASLINDTSISNITALPAGVGGKVLQVVNATFGTATTSSSSTFADLGLSASITPSSTSNKILVTVHLSGCQKNNNALLGTRLLRGSTTIYTIDNMSLYTATTNENACGSVSTSYLDSPSTTSATTYKVQFRSVTNVSYVYINNDYSGGSSSNITLMEIAG